MIKVKEIFKSDIYSIFLIQILNILFQMQKI